MLPAIQWRIDIGDPTLLGWAVTIGYGLSASACLSAWHRLRLGPRRLGTTLWLALAVVLFLLGVNKQLDLQTLCIEVGRWIAESTGWYEQRRRIQLGFVVTVILGGVGMAILIARPITCFLRQHRLATLGSGLIAGYVCRRMLTINHVDDALPHPAWLEDWLGLLELAGTLAVLWNARQIGRITPTPAQTDPQR